MLDLSAAETIAAKCQHDANQTRHRIGLINEWRIEPGSKVLEIGCGQGECTAVLATAVGAEGYVDAVDPASLDYGAPVTLGEAQSVISKTDLGDRINWNQISPLDFLLAMDEGKTYDVAVLVHSIWYFPSQDILIDILRALRGKAKRVCIAEYALSASIPAAMPHVLAALTRATLEAHKRVSDENIQTALAPARITAIAEETEWKLVHQMVITPHEGLLDGSWEVGTVKREEFLAEIDSAVYDERVKVLLWSMRAAVLNSLATLGPEVGARTMDTWVAEFK
ncbi:S-adenosyl-L-methionine-dependent methyltransferase [Glonium stellatum]|uniref:S-adenosyl-L-methionine-dependent methyltransferase n=1 Tax=Glonium stellatum TaxID=574774 RepID=A0A8E2JLL2_9PEZI|nr:S-adenosyl-L-methionine-dependent methyltransferase [Glonium stellatum]